MRFLSNIQDLKMKQVLFVCLGNICRSPGAEAVFNALIGKNGMENKLSCDSAGTAAYQIPGHLIRFMISTGLITLSGWTGRMYAI